ncbi:hypothetical protein PIB30_000379, partial [Stylosanthes scabra]|nr:hypothetical protein [Stylosanthes scabra]
MKVFGGVKKQVVSKRVSFFAPSFKNQFKNKEEYDEVDYGWFGITRFPCGWGFSDDRFGVLRSHHIHSLRCRILQQHQTRFLIHY